MDEPTRKREEEKYNKPNKERGKGNTTRSALNSDSDERWFPAYLNNGRRVASGQKYSGGGDKEGTTDERPGLPHKPQSQPLWSGSRPLVTKSTGEDLEKAAVKTKVFFSFLNTARKKERKKNPPRPPSKTPDDPSRLPPPS
ncbi:hypothetical protein OUZ56_013148 [Daphnia magna]|uniref:Uncharacterized protein n=1 Tax=Daphnia magna TaxID=35525 RepID=A0ABQ9Z688_9CRUS|nr:hypothetical protein OUZ56_013148 [Daphnia magna]